MAKISALPVLAKPTGAEKVVVLDGGKTKQANLSGLAFDDSTASLLASRILASVAIARPIGGNASLLFADVPDTSGGAPFDVLIVATNTAAQTTMTAGGVTTLIANAGGVPIPAGGLPTGRIATIAYAPNGGAFILKSLRDVAGQDAINLSLRASGLLAGVPVAFRTGPADLRAEVPDAADGNAFDVLLVTTNALAATYLTAGGVTGLIANGGGVAIPPNGLPAGKIATFAYSVQGGAFVLNGLRDVAGQIAINDSVKAAGVLAGVPVAIRTALAELRAEVANAANGNAFDILLVATNTTAKTYLTSGGITRLVVNGGGNPIPAGGLPAGKIATIAYSLQGGAFVLNGLRDFRQASTSSTDDSTYTTRPWGNITFPGGTRSVVVERKGLVVLGSSNAAVGYVPDALLPANVGANALNEFLPGEGVVVEGSTLAEHGAPFTAAAGQLAKSVAFQAGLARWVMLMFGMNDARTIFYHSFGGIMAQIDALRGMIETIRKGGAEPILSTIFPPDPRASTTALDPDWFSDTRPLPEGGSTQDMNFPAYRASPVDPENHMTPARSQALTEPRAWTETGIKRVGYKRIWHVNRLIRRVGAETDCVVLDYHASTYRNCIETVPDLADGLSTFYDRDNPLHPLPPLYEGGVVPPIRQWALHAAEGRTDRLVFDGRE